jgi:uncharacterized membrane protein HdeD (DUF308 family)
MSILTIIFGIIMVVGGSVLLCTPIATTFGIMYYYMILMFVTGIIFLAKCIAYKRFGIDLFFAILSIIAGGFMIFSPQVGFATETIILYIMASWLVIRGVIGIVNAFAFKQLIGTGVFVLSLISSILVIISGVYSFVHPLVFAGFLGILACCYFIVEGIDMIFLGCIGKQIEREIR